MNIKNNIKKSKGKTLTEVKKDISNKIYLLSEEEGILRSALKNIRVHGYEEASTVHRLTHEIVVTAEKRKALQDVQINIQEIRFI